MAIANWNPDKKIIEINTHSMSGKPMNVPFDDAYTQPVNDARGAFVMEFLQSQYPEEDIEIIGAPWDYTATTQPTLHNNTPVGDYRVKIGDREALLHVDLNDGQQAIALGAEVFEAFKAQGVDVTGPIKLPNDNWTRQKDGYYLHLSQYRADTKPIFNVGLQNHHAALGQMVGQMYNAGHNLPEDLAQDLEKFTDNVTLRAWRDGLAIAKNLNSDEGFEALQKDSDIDLKALFDDAVGNIQPELDAVLSSENRLATSFNIIEKMVHINKKGGLTFTSYDTPSRGFVPMLTKNATYDVGLAVYRILMDKRFYADGQNTFQNIEDGIDSFIKAYNTETGLNLTCTEAIQAAKLTNGLDTVISLGFTKNSPKGDDITLKDIVNHLKTNKAHHIQNIKAVTEQYKRVQNNIESHWAFGTGFDDDALIP